MELGDIEIDLLFALNALVHSANAVDREANKVPAEQVAINRVELFAEIPPVLLRDLRWAARIHRVSRGPKASALSANRLRNQATLVLAGDGCRVNLDHLRIPVLDALLVADRNSRAGVDDRVRALAEDESATSGCEDCGVAGERVDAHVPQVLRGDSNTDAVCILDQTEEFPGLVLLDKSGNFPPSDLFIESVEKLLTGCRTRVSGDR